MTKLSKSNVVAFMPAARMARRVQSAPRRPLVCHWRVCPVTGRLVCTWTEAVRAAATPSYSLAA
jgi:hypothetical protein